MFLSDNINIILIEDEEFDVERVKNTLKPFSEKIKICDVVSDGISAMEFIEENKNKYDVAIMDYQIAGGLKGVQLIKKIKTIDPALQIIVITKMTTNIMDFEFANSLIEAGAFWYCTKYPGDIEDYIYQPTDFLLSIINAFEKKKLQKENTKSNARLEKKIEDILENKKIIGVSNSAQRLKDQIIEYAKSNVSILILGASGTGKELVAHNIHYNSNRKYENFIAINCGSLPEQLVESELFGYEKGAFTGAEKRKPGLFELANHGTIFLDEIAELPLNVQVKLLRVIQEGELEKIGRTEKVKVDVRIIAASNKNLEQEVKARRFREDLYYRLNVVPIRVPQLKERKEDLPVLIDFFIKEFAKDMGRDPILISSEAMNEIYNYEWPGNVRELKNVIQRLFFANEEVISKEKIKPALGNCFSIYEDEKSFSIESQIVPLNEFEKKAREKYVKFVRENSNSDNEAARKLGMAPSNYSRMIKDLDIR